MERRAARRYALDAAVEYRVLKIEERRFLQFGRVVNMSRNGVLLQTESRLQPGTQIELSVDWPARPRDALRRLVIWGWVVRQCERDVAVSIRHYAFESQFLPG